MARKNLMNTYGRFDLTLESGYRSKVKDVNGVEYLDFISGIAVNTLGHSNPKIIETISNQSRKLMHVSNNFWTEPMVDLAGILAKYRDRKSVV